MVIAARICPNDVRLTLEQAIPGGMSLEDYSLMREVIAAIREGMPSADQMQPGQVFQHVLEALHDCSKKDRNTNSSICFVPRYLNGGRLSLAQGYDGSRDAINPNELRLHENAKGPGENPGPRFLRRPLAG